MEPSLFGLLLEPRAVAARRAAQAYSMCQVTLGCAWDAVGVSMHWSVLA